MASITSGLKLEKHGILHAPLISCYGYHVMRPSEAPTSCTLMKQIGLKMQMET